MDVYTGNIIARITDLDHELQPLLDRIGMLKQKWINESNELEECLDTIRDTLAAKRATMQ